MCSEWGVDTQSNLVSHLLNTSRELELEIGSPTKHPNGHRAAAQHYVAIFIHHTQKVGHYMSAGLIIQLLHAHVRKRHICAQLVYFNTL